MMWVELSFIFFPKLSVCFIFNLLIAKRAKLGRGRMDMIQLELSFVLHEL